MEPSTRRYLVTALVRSGAFVLFAPAAGVAVLIATTRLAETVGVAVRTVLAFRRGWEDRPIDPLG